MKIGLFPGRFQPFTNAHLERLLAIRAAYPAMKLVVVLGDVGCLNRENFLHVEERREMIEQVCQVQGIADVTVTPVAAAYPPCRWVRNVLDAVPEAGTVFSDNPFVYEPLQAVGLVAVVHQRSGPDGSCLRGLPFPEWRAWVPPEVYDYLENRGLHIRMQGLPATGRYPFLGERKAGDGR